MIGHLLETTLIECIKELFWFSPIVFIVGVIFVIFSSILIIEGLKADAEFDKRIDRLEHPERYRKR